MSSKKKSKKKAQLKKKTRSVTAQSNTAKKTEKTRKTAQTAGTTEDQSTDKSIASTVGTMFLWAICFCMALFGLAFLVSAVNIFYVIVGILGLILAVMTCPYITSKTKGLSWLRWYYKAKVPIVIALFVLVFVLLYVS